MKKRRPIQLPPATDIPREAWDGVYRYLTQSIAQARRARCAAVYASRIDPTGAFRANAVYWKHCEGSLKWFRGQLVRQWSQHGWTHTGE